MSNSAPQTGSGQKERYIGRYERNRVGAFLILVAIPTLLVGGAILTTSKGVGLVVVGAGLLIAFLASRIIGSPVGRRNIGPTALLVVGIGLIGFGCLAIL